MGFRGSPAEAADAGNNRTADDSQHGDRRNRAPGRRVHRRRASAGLINRSVEDDRVGPVVNDNAVGIRLTVAHMAALGHTSIAHLAGPQEISTGHARYRAFIEAMTERGLDADPALIAFCETYSEDEGRRALRELFAKDTGFTAAVLTELRFPVAAFENLPHAVKKTNVL